MGNRLYTAAIVAVWLVSMGWLVKERILPPFFGGDAPVTSVCNQIEPVAWRIAMDGRECGVAVLQAVEADGGVREVHSVLRLDKIEAPESIPGWLAPTLDSLRDLTLAMRTLTTYDSLGGLASFATDLDIGGIETKVELNGRIRDGTLELTARAGGFSKRFEHPWPREAALGSELTPTARLLPLYEGRRWRREVYSPFASPKAPLEQIEAVVTERLRPTYRGVSFNAWRVEYRTVDKTGSNGQDRLRASLVVAEDGVVREQEIYFFGSMVSMKRLSEKESQRLADRWLELDQRATVEVPQAKPAKEAS